MKLLIEDNGPGGVATGKIRIEEQVGRVQEGLETDVCVKKYPPVLTAAPGSGIGTRTLSVVPDKYKGIINSLPFSQQPFYMSGLNFHIPERYQQWKWRFKHD